MRNPDDFLGYIVVRVGHVLSHHFEVVLTPRQFAVLAHLTRDPGLGSSELARLVLITPQSIGPLLDGLAATGYLVRTPASRGKRRTTSLTAVGAARLAAAVPAVVAFEQRVTAWLTVNEGVATNLALHSVLRTMLAELDESQGLFRDTSVNLVSKATHTDLPRRVCSWRARWDHAGVPLAQLRIRWVTFATTATNTSATTATNTSATTATTTSCDATMSQHSCRQRRECACDAWQA